jgi:hypothetical protein
VNECLIFYLFISKPAKTTTSLSRLLDGWHAYAVYAAELRMRTKKAVQLSAISRSKRAWKAWMALVQLHRIGKAIFLGYEVIPKP